MSYLSNQAPKVKNADLWNWIRPNYDFPHGANLPQNPSDGDFFKQTGVTPNQFFQYLTNDGWVNLGPSAGFNVGQIPTGTSPLQIYDTASTQFVNLFLVYNDDPDPSTTPAPLLMTDQGFIVKKDLMVGGFIDSGQGALWLNYGLYGRPELSSPPCIQLMSSSANYPSGTSFPNPGENGYEKGQLFNLTQVYYWNGHNYAADKYMWNGSDWVTGGFSGKYDTLFLFKSDAITPAHLDLGDLTVHGQIFVKGNTEIEWTTYASDQWVNLGGFWFRNSYNDKNMEFKATTHWYDDDYYPIMQMLYYDYDGADPVTIFQFDMCGDFYYLGYLYQMDYMDDVAALRAIKTKKHTNGRTIYDPDTVKFLQGENGLYSLNACLGWELSIQRKFLQEIDDLKSGIAGLQLQIADIKTKVG